MCTGCARQVHRIENSHACFSLYPAFTEQVHVPACQGFPPWQLGELMAAGKAKKRPGASLKRPAAAKAKIEDEVFHTSNEEGIRGFLPFPPSWLFEKTRAGRSRMFWRSSWSWRANLERAHKYG